MTSAAPRRITRLLVANRGEIACRIFRTAHAMGIGSVAVYAPPDSAAKHVREADVSVPLVGDSVATTYLDIDQVVAAAVRTGADAVHPGYGFLAENADLAGAVLAAGLVWVGPRSETVRLMGSKVAAKQAAASAGVPLPASAELVGDDAGVWVEAAARIGFPLLVKASAGGGGKGMRLVTGADELADAVRAARREAASAFGDPAVFAERLLTGARHVEVQVFGDEAGEVIQLGERECSVQRRHQKVVEESPSPGVTAATREQMCAAAVALARSVGYVGAGTVEFLVVGDGAAQDHVFLEMNTRLQVEHPVTEAVTGLDLVALQLRVAAGLPLGLTPDDVRPAGHAIEVRAYAEDPAVDHLPSTGTLSRWDEAAGVRWDSGVDAGDTVSTSYDPMLAKVVAHAPDRATAAAVLARALRTSVVHGVTTNLASLAAVLESESFLAGDTRTTFLDEHPELLAPVLPPAILGQHVVAAALHASIARRDDARVLPLAPNGWRNVGMPAQRVQYVTVGGAASGGTMEVTYRATEPSEFLVAVGDATPARALVHGCTPRSLDLELVDGGPRVTFAVSGSPATDSEAGEVWVTGLGHTSRLLELPRFPAAVGAPSAGASTARVPGTVTAVLVEVGARVGEGQPLVLLEAMKMEHRIVAAVSGTVTKVLVAAGDPVDAHQELVTVEPAGEGVA